MSIIILWIVFGIVGYMIGAGKGSGCLGFILGILLGPIGWLISALASDGKIPCAYCKEKVNPKAVICPHCRKDLIPDK